jgi:hypothetical protein
VRGKRKPDEVVAVVACDRSRFRFHSVHALVALVAASVTAHVIASFSRATIVYLPDEYLYSELSRSFSSSGLPLVRGSLVAFPSLLQPIVTAPFWRLGSVEIGFRASMVAGSVAMSLAAVPVYWLGRRLGLSGWLALGPSAFALATPSMLYSSWMMGEPFAYPLFLAGFAMGVLALSGEGRWLAPALLVFVLASLARIQLLILPISFAVAAVVMAALERRLRRFVHEHRYLIGLLALVLVAVLTVPVGAFGFYGDVRHLDLAPIGLAHHLGVQVLALFFTCAWIVLPAGMIGLAMGLARPRSRTELAFASSAVVVVVGLLCQTSLYGVASIPQERYIFYCAPVLALCLALLADRGWPGKRIHALAVLVIVAIAAVIPMSTWASAASLSQSSFLIASYKLERIFGVGDGSLVVAIAISILAVLAAVLPLRKGRAGTEVFVLAVAFSATAMALAVNFDDFSGAQLQRAQAREKGRIDRLIEASGRSSKGAYLLQGFSPSSAAVSQLFWNRSVDRVALLPKSTRPDVLSWPSLRIGPDGALSVGGKPLEGPLVIDTHMETVDLRNAIEAGRVQAFSVWLPRGRPYFTLYASGFWSGQVAPVSTIRIWPDKPGGRLAGYVSFRLQSHRLVGTTKLSLSILGAVKRSFRVARGESRLVRIAVCRNGPWHASMTGKPFVLRGSSLISALSTAPVWRASARACTVPASERVIIR